MLQIVISCYFCNDETALEAASVKSCADIIGRALVSSNFLASSTLVPTIITKLLFLKHELPSSRTMRGNCNFISLHAAIIPFAIVTQFTIPPKMLTKIALT